MQTDLSLAGYTCQKVCLLTLHLILFVSIVPGPSPPIPHPPIQKVSPTHLPGHPQPFPVSGRRAVDKNDLCINLFVLSQERLIESHGLQCGFCTPGFVMSMFCLLRNNPSPTKDDVERALEGK